ncbi:MAG: PBP1A family penicillin-binding protein [Clostridia bacterium]|nr:PBP1A family penicillin-binding protein [Clostridia bacterium]
MRKYIKWAILAVAAALLTALILALDVPHWQRLDVSKVRAAAGATEVFDMNGDRAGTLTGRENRRWVSLDQVPADVQEAFIAAEDLRFYRHHGVDFYRVFGALWHDLKTMSFAQGASTITQQLIKLTHLSSAKSLSRKAQEIALALQLEKVMDKREILEAYLNTIYFGHGAYGIEAAADVYFDKTASELTVAEGALLAGIIKAPSTYAPHLDPEKSLKRRDGILSTMAEAGFITEDEAVTARAEGLKLAENAEDSRLYAWYMDAVLTEAAQVLDLSNDEVLTGGYAILTGLDLSMQSAAEALFTSEERFPAAASDGTPVQASLIALDSMTGEVRAVVGGRSYDVALGLNHATQIRRQPGSAFKPVSTYAAAIDAYGFVPSSTVEDTPRTFDGGYAPRNAGGASYGTVTLREALSRSLNIATVDLADLIGTDALRQYAQRFGIPLSDRDVNLSLALGALTDGVSPEVLGGAYCALANGGLRVTPHFIREIRDAAGHAVYRADAAQPRAVQASTAYMLTDMLKTAARSGSARALKASGVPVAGKTGTVSDEATGGTRDIWTVAYTPELATAVWMGFDQPDKSHMLPSSEGGSGYPARLCAAFLKAVSDDLSGRDFKKPKAVKAALVDRLALEQEHLALLTTGDTPTEYTATELFHADDVPDAYSDNWSAPRMVAELKLLTGPGETPVLSFTPRESNVEYQLLRRSGGETKEIAVLSGEPGQEVRFTDTAHDLSQPADYALMPRNALLFAAGTLASGPQSPSVHYAPGGWLNTIMGAGMDEATPAPTEIELFGESSLFE